MKGMVIEHQRYIRVPPFGDRVEFEGRTGMECEYKAVTGAIGATRLNFMGGRGGGGDCTTTEGSIRSGMVSTLVIY